MIIDSPTYGYFKILFDKDDYDKVKQHNWSISKCWNKKTNTEPKFYPSATVYDSGKGKTRKCHGILMHRYLTDAPKGMVVDHIKRVEDHICDNRRENLRICTQSQNLMNYVTKPSNNTSGHIGVCWDKSTNKWIAHLRLMGKHKHLGYYDDFEDAVNARREGELKYYGKYRSEK